MEEDRAANQRSAFALSITLALYISNGFGLNIFYGLYRIGLQCTFHKFLSTFLERNYLLECAVQVLDKDASCENYDFDSLEEEEMFENTVGRIKTNYFGKPRNTNDMFKDGNPNYEYQCFANINSFVLLRPYPQQQREPIRLVFILDICW